MEIKNITIAEYTTIEDRSLYDALLRYATDSKDIFTIGDFTQLAFGIVKELQYKYSKGVTIKDILEFISEIKKIDMVELGKLTILEYIKINNFIRKQIEFINSIEENALVGSIDNDEQEADIERFNKFGYLNQINSLAGGDITKYELIKNTVYIDCFTKMYLDKEQNDYRETLNKIRTRRNGKV